MGLDSNVQLLLAVMDLKLVQMLRVALTDDAAFAGGCKRATELGPAPNNIERRYRFTPEPVIERRDHYTPTPRIEPREVIHPTPRVEPAPPPIEVPPCYTAPKKKCGLVPPWKVMPWENPPQPALKIKVIKVRPDIVRKGSLVDCFL